MSQSSTTAGIWLEASPRDRSFQKMVCGWTPLMKKRTQCKKMHWVEKGHREDQWCRGEPMSSASSVVAKRRHFTELESVIVYRGSTMENSRWLAMTPRQQRCFTNLVRSASHKGICRWKDLAVSCRRRTTTALPTLARRWRRQRTRADGNSVRSGRKGRVEHWGHADILTEAEARGEVSGHRGVACGR